MKLSEIIKKCEPIAINYSINKFLLALVIKSIEEDNGNLSILIENKKLKELINELSEKHGFILYINRKYEITRNTDLYKAIYPFEVSHNSIIELWNNKRGIASDNSEYALLTSEGRSKLYSTTIDLVTLYKTSYVYLEKAKKNNYKMTVTLKNFILNFDSKYKQYELEYIDDDAKKITINKKLNDINKKYYR